MSHEPPEEPAAWSDLVDLWLGLIAGLVVAGPAVALVTLPYALPLQIGLWAPVVLVAGLLLLLCVPLAVAWSSRRADWTSAGLTAVAAGLAAALASLPLAYGAAHLLGVHIPSGPGVLAATGGIGASVAVAARRTCSWSTVARFAAVVAVLLAPLLVLAGGEALTPTPVAVAHSMWIAAPVGVIPLLGLADTAAAALGQRGQPAPPAS